MTRKAADNSPNATGFKSPVKHLGAYRKPKGSGRSELEENSQILQYFVFPGIHHITYLYRKSSSNINIIRIF